MDFQLGDWLIEPSLNRISRRGESTKLEPRVMELLELLALRPNQLFTKDEISERLWPGTFVTESSLFRHVSELRRALGDDPRRPQYVETIPKRGYRLVGEISAVQTTRRERPTSIPLWGTLALLAVVTVWLMRADSRESAGPASAAASDYLEGELFENRIDCTSFDRALSSYSEARSRDPEFVEVYPRLFDALVASAVLGCRPPQTLFSELASLLDLARRHGLDKPRETQGRAALAFWRDGDVDSALAGFRSAENEEEDLSYGMTLVASGLPDEGVRVARRCLEALPVDLGENWAMGGVLYLAGRYDEASDQFLHTLELYPDFRPALQLLALSYWMAGDTERALAAAAKSEPESGERYQRFDAVPGYIYAVAGNGERAREILAEWTARSEKEWVPKTSLALLHLGLGEHDEARKWLGEAKREQDPWVVLLATDPAFRPLQIRGTEISLRVP